MALASRPTRIQANFRRVTKNKTHAAIVVLNSIIHTRKKGNVLMLVDEVVTLPQTVAWRLGNRRIHMVLKLYCKLTPRELKAFKKKRALQRLLDNSPVLK